VTYHFGHFGPAESVRAAAPDASAAADAVVHLLGESFVDAAGGCALRAVRFHRLTDADAAGSDGDPLVAQLARRLRAEPVAAASHATGDGSVLGFGGALGAGDAFVVTLTPTAPIGARVVERLTTLAAGIRSGLLFHGDPAARDRALVDQLRLAEDALAGRTAALEADVGRIGAEADVLGMLHAVGRRLMAQLDLDTLVQDATETATKATGASFGAFFYNLVDDHGESYTLYTLAGAPRSAFERFPMPRNTNVFAPTFTGEGTVRCADITADPRYGHNPPYAGMPEGHLPVRSYLAVPVVSPTSHEVLGGFFFGNREPGRFTASHEQIAEGIAGYAAIALDNARLYARQRGLATELQRSMLPVVPRVPGLSIVSRYLPAAAASEVGGDWIDVMELPAGRTAFVVGDVMGRGIAAAAVMGQIRTAVRAYAMLDLPPADVLRNASEVAASMPGQQFVTCVYAVHDPADGSLTYANAGHPAPALLGADGQVTVLHERLGLPLSLGRDYRQREVAFPAGSGIALFTDGLVEQRRKPLEQGVGELGTALRGIATIAVDELEAACDRLVRDVTGGRYDDDVALLYARNVDRARRAAVMPLRAAADVAARARRFIRQTMARWGLDAASDTAATVATELVTNAVRHADGPVRLRLHHTGSRLIIDVTDTDQRLPRRFDPAPDEERHRGLFMVDAFARRWGSRPTPDGKVVWAELAVPEPAVPEPA
jgi:anti-sigma regulatory factor (Ser/Thr protein kinase)